jgi:agmatine deiminase
MLGAEKVIWLERGLVDDETDGHVDEVATFARPGVVLALTTADSTDDNHPILKDNLDRLKAATDARGRQLEVIELPQPAKRTFPDGRRWALSYTNLYIANGGIVAPAFEVPEDDRAFRILREAFPDRRVVQVLANDIVFGGGGIHCITQQQPAP